jgi:hypothetical protein
MYFFYGADSKYIDITHDVFTKCMKDTQIYIPKGDLERTVIFGDPLPNILKEIYIVDPLGNKYHFNSKKEIKINYDSISAHLKHLALTPREWYNNTGTKIIDYIERLSELHNHLVLYNGSLMEEFPEQLMALKFIHPDAKVLEIGGNIGRNTLIINSIIDDSKNLVTLESDAHNAKVLEYNLKVNGFDSYVEPTALSKIPLIQKHWDTKPLEGTEIPEGWVKCNTINYEDFMKKYNINFDTLVADCEGALYHILKDYPMLLDGINLVLIENDFHDLDHKIFVDSLFISNGLKRLFVAEGPWGPCKDCFYEVWGRE